MERGRSGGSACIYTYGGTVVRESYVQRKLLIGVYGSGSSCRTGRLEIEGSGSSCRTSRYSSTNVLAGLQALSSAILRCLVKAVLCMVGVR